MIFPSFIPKAQKLTKEEIDYPGLNDRVICGFFPVTAYLIILVVVFVTLIILELFGGYFENISFFRGVDWENVPVFRNILSIGGYGGIG